MEKIQISKIQIILSLLAVVLLTVLLASQWKSSGSILSSEPTIFEGHQKVSENSELRMTFAEQIDNESLKEYLNPPIEGEASWEGNTLVFKPEKKLKEGETYTFIVNRDAKYMSGKPLQKEAEFRFTITGPPKLSSSYPSNEAKGIEPKTKVHLVFDRPMIPLSAVQGSGAKKYRGKWPVTIKPAVSGKWRWLGTSTVEFTPNQEFKSATTYTIRMPKGIVSVNGDKTNEDFSWSFETKRPKVTSAQPKQGSKLSGPGSAITLSFSQKMDLARAKKSIIFQKFAGESLSALAFDLGYGYDEIEEGKKKLNRQKLVIIPKNPLEIDSRYQVIAEKGTLAAEGNLGSTREYLLDFSTVGDFKVDRYEFLNNRISLYFNNPVNDESLKRNILIEPTPEGWDEIEFKTSEWSNKRELYIYKNFDPSTTYKLTLNDSIKDAFSQKLNEPYTYEFTTEALSSNLDILSDGDFGIFEKNKTPVYSFEGVNISKINLEISRVPLDQFIQIRQNEKNNYRFEPDLQNYIGYQAFTLERENKLDEWENSYFDIEKKLGHKMIPGIYALHAQAPEYVRSSDKKPYLLNQYFSVTNNAITLKYSGSKALVWLVNMQTGKPVPQADIIFYNMKGEKVLTGQTDGEGFFESKIDLKAFQTNKNEWAPEFWVTGSKDGDFTFLGSNWNNGLKPWNFGIQDSFYGPQKADYLLDAYLYTERQAYRPGDSVYFKGISRVRDKNGVVRIPNDFEVSVKIYDAKHNEIYDKVLPVNEYGTFNGEITLDPETSLGKYDISMELIPDDRMEINYDSHSFYVLEYRKPEYKVEVTPEETNYFGGDDVAFKVTGDYYFGAPMNDADVSWHAVMSDYWFNRYTDGWYSFALEDNWCWWKCNARKESLTEGEGKLDKNGDLEVHFPVNLDDKGISQMVTLHADITDSNNQVVSSSETVPVHKADLYVGVRMQDYAVSPGEKAKVNIVTVNPDGTPRGSERVTVSLYSREWNSIKKKNVDGYYYYENEPKDTFLRKTTITTEKNGKATAELLIEEGGSYRVVAEAKDSRGRDAKAGTSFYGFSSTYINWPHSNNDRIEVIADKPEYQVGDTAKLLFKSPYQGEGVKALVTIERENVISKKVIDVSSNAQPIEVLITEDLIPNAYVSVVIVKPRTSDEFDEDGRDTGMPGFKIGYTKLKVETSQKELTLKVETDKQKYGPGEIVEVQISTTNYTGEPTQAEVSLGVVDLSVQALLGFHLPNLLLDFYEERGLGVQTSQMLTYLIEAFKPGSKGGGGSDAESKARENFKDTAYWNPVILTDANGQATVSFKLPDNLTTWQLLAIGSTKNHEYGAVTHEIIETKKTILRPLRPRFAVEGDQINIGATVHNFTEETQDYVITLDGEGFKTNKGSEKRMTIRPNEMAKVIMPVTIEPVKKASFHFKAQGKGAVDEITESIPVYEFGTQQSVATSGLTETSVTEKVYIPSSEEVRRGNLSTTISPTLATYLPKGLEYLATFPYGCTEQTVSSFLPNVALKSLQNFDAFEIVDEVTLEKNVSAGLARLYNYQRGDGGFGYWSNSNKSYPYLTAYVSFALQKTRDADYSVDDQVIDRANNYLQNVLRKQNMEDKIDLTTRAYILYVLSENNQRDLSLLNNLYDKRTELPLFARAYLAMAYGNSNEKGRNVLQEVVDMVKIDARGAHFEEENEGYWRFSMNTNNRTSAIVLQAMVRLMPDQDMIPKLVRHMLDIRQEGRWDTTQSTVASIFALTEFLKETGELNADYAASIMANNDEILSQNFNTENILSKEEVKLAFEELEEEAYTDLVLSKEGEGRMYYDISIDYFLTLDTIEPTDQGIGIVREITSLETGEKDYHVQGTYKNKLTITVPEDRHFVAISSPLPAGFETIDFTLQISQQDLRDEVNQSENGYWWDNPIWRFNHKEFRDDEVFLFADYLPAGVYEYEYLTRATTAGSFRERPARAWEMYYPETFGQTSGGWLEIKE